jgi:prepilin-type N-terminal cleavage/methylation domain-containing protein
MRKPAYYLIVMPNYNRPVHRLSGFTLIELSVVLVIIGLIVGGILVGQDLIETAGVRAQVSQIEKNQASVNTFRTKYNCLPGDCANAADFGFVARGPNRGQGDGNGLIEGYSAWFGTENPGTYESAGETSVFWVDLSAAQLTDGSFTTATMNDYTGSPLLSVSDIMPAGKTSGASYVYVWSDNSANYFGLADITLLGWSVPWAVPGVRVSEAYYIDSKIDDGLPQTGNVTAKFLNYGYQQGGGGNIGAIWAKGGSAISPSPATAYGTGVGADPGTAENAGPLTCYDNSGDAGNPMQYSMSQSDGANPDCALSFRFQ